MHKFNSKLLAAGLLAASLTACGGGDGGLFVNTPAASTPGPVAGGGTTTDISKSVTDLFAYLGNLISGSTSDLGDPVDINSLTLATDDAADPVSLN